MNLEIIFNIIARQFVAIHPLQYSHDFVYVLLIFFNCLDFPEEKSFPINTKEININRGLSINVYDNGMFIRTEAIAWTLRVSRYIRCSLSCLHVRRTWADILTIVQFLFLVVLCALSLHVKESDGLIHDLCFIGGICMSKT